MPRRVPDRQDVPIHLLLQERQTRAEAQRARRETKSAIVHAAVEHVFRDHPFPGPYLVQRAEWDDLKRDVVIAVAQSHRRMAQHENALITHRIHDRLNRRQTRQSELTGSQDTDEPMFNPQPQFIRDEVDDPSAEPEGLYYARPPQYVMTPSGNVVPADHALGGLPDDAIEEADEPPPPRDPIEDPDTSRERFLRGFMDVPHRDYPEVDFHGTAVVPLELMAGVLHPRSPPRDDDADDEGMPVPATQDPREGPNPYIHGTYMHQFEEQRRRR